MSAAVSWDERPEVARLVRALLHEGYLLYPYRPSAVKNRFRWTVGALLPRPPQGEAAAEPSGLAVDLLAVAPEGAFVATRLAFLHVLERPASTSDGAAREAVQEAVERAVDLPPFALGGPPRTDVVEVAADAGQGAVQEPLRLEVRRAASRVGGGPGAAWRVALEVENGAAPWPLATPRTTAILRAPVAVHALVRVEAGGLASLREPPAGLEAEATRCRCLGAWPVLLGAPPLAEEALVSPVILDEPPALAPESPGDLFDATEMDGMLVLRLLTLGEDEAREAAAADPRARALLERARRLGPDERAPLHGVVRRLTTRPGPVGPGDRVRLRPRSPGAGAGRRADVLDGALAGRAATVVAVEHDVEGRAHVAVVVDDDPGRDLGVRGDIPGHRFFFGHDEVEPLAPGGGP